VKHLRWLKGPRPGWIRLARPWWLIYLAVALVTPLSLPGHASQAQSYESLRLFTEALFEISQKYVYPKNEDEMIYGALRGMANSLDPDSAFLTPQEYQSYLQGQKAQPAEAGIELLFKDNILIVASVIDGGPGSQAGLKPDDHIIKIDGHLVHNLTTQEAAIRFRGAPGTNLKLQVMRNGAVKPLDLTLSLGSLAASTVTSQFLDDGFAYIRIRYFNDGTPGELAAALTNIKGHQPPVKGVILDLRNNARGTLEQAVRTASMLLGEQEIVLTKGRAPETEESFKGKTRDLIFKPPIPMVVLVDQSTARAAEIMAAALRDQYQATLLGTKTMGLCGLTKVMPLQDGSALVMTVSQCFAPRGQKIQGKGLEPEVAGKTPPASKEAAEKGAPKSLAPAQDPWVQQAVDWLKSGKSRQVAQEGAPS
jgi:carboxyl-terminal processing protease